MSYVPTTWIDGETPVNAENLNKLESAVKANDDAIYEINTARANGEFKGEQGDTGPQGPAGPQGAQGESGPVGEAGKSAYQYAKEAGYTGTEAEFSEKLASGGGSGIHIGTEAPTDPNVNAWIDTDEEAPSGGSGGGSGADLLNEYGFLKSSVLPPLYGYGTVEGYSQRFPLGTMIFSEDFGGYVSADPVRILIPGTKYDVTYNGAEYSCVCKDGGEMGAPGTYLLGNYAMIEGTGDSGEPFVCMISPNGFEDTQGVTVALIPLDGELTSYFHIEGNAFVPSPFDQRYSRAEPLVINITNDNTGKLIASCSYKEAYDAIMAGRNVTARSGVSVFHVAEADKNYEISFFTYSAGKFVEVTWSSSGEITFSNL